MSTDASPRTEANASTAQSQEPQSNTLSTDTSQNQKPARRSSLTKIIDAVKKPFHHEKEPPPPALQEAIDKMEARKQSTVKHMEMEGKDTSLLSGKRVDQVKDPLGG